MNYESFRHSLIGNGHYQISIEDIVNENDAVEQNLSNDLKKSMKIAKVFFILSGIIFILYLGFIFVTFRYPSNQGSFWLYIVIIFTFLLILFVGLYIFYFTKSKKIKKEWEMIKQNRQLANSFIT